MSIEHEYVSRLVWKGNLGNGTSTYAGYSREYMVSVDGKPDIRGTADPMFRGDPDLHNPEDLFIAAISSCHMLSYLALCALKGVSVAAYEDRATAILALDSNRNGSFEEVTLNPVVTIADSSTEALAIKLHDEAHDLCYIARSCSVPIHHAVTIRIAEGGGSQQ